MIFSNKTVISYNQYGIIRILGFTQNCIDILAESGQQGNLTSRQIKEIINNLIAIRKLGTEQFSGKLSNFKPLKSQTNKNQV